jgi:mycofactocin precursor
MKETLLHQGTRKAFLARADRTPASPLFGDGARRSGQSEQSPGAAAAQQITVNELSLLIEDDAGPLGERSLGGRGGEGEEIAHVVSLSRLFRGLFTVGQNGDVRGGTVTPDTLIVDETVEVLGVTEELLVEEVSIDGLCGVY